MGNTRSRKKVPEFPPDLENGDTAALFQSVQGRCAVMSTVSLTTSTYSSSSEKLSKTDSTTLSKKKEELLRNFTRSYSLTSNNEAPFKLSSGDRRFSFDDILDEKEEDLRPERTASLSQLLDLEGVHVEHKSQDTVRQSSRTSSMETMSSGDNRTRIFAKKKIMHDISSSLSSLSKVTISSKAFSSQSTQSAQNLNHTGTNETKSCPLSQVFQRSKNSPTSKTGSNRPPQAPKADKLQDDFDLLAKAVESPDQELAMGRVIARMDALIDNLKNAICKKEELDTLYLMNDLIRKSWAVSTVGYDLGSSLCKSLLNKGGIELLLNNFTSEDDAIKFESARLLEQTLTTDVRSYIATKDLSTVVQVACECSTSPCVEKTRVGAGILEHLFKTEEHTCDEVIRLGGLSAILYECRNMDIETLRHCAAALANLSLHGGHENQEAMIQHKVPEWLFPLAFHTDDNIKYYACLAIATLVANKEIEAAVLRSGTLDLVEPFITTHSPAEFAQSTVAHVHGQSKTWLLKLIPVLNSKREEARSLAAFHFAMEAGIKKRQGNTSLFREIGVINCLKNVASSPNALASKYAAQALQLIGEPVPHKLSQQVPLWTVEDVVEWVKQIGFSEYTQEFLNSRVDGDLLLQMTEKSLENDICLANGLLRKRFLRDLNQLKCLADYSSCDTTSLSSFLQSTGPEFCQYTYQMLLSGVQTDSLRDLVPEQLEEECGITNSIHRMRLMRAIKGLSCNRNGLDSGEELNPKSLDVFISYRRSNGSQLASLLKVHLQLRGFSVFIDVERLEAGKFDNNLLNSVRQARHFLLVLTANALDRCINDTECKDWVHREIVEALKCQCNIIPILDNFQWPEAESLPEDMRAVSYFNGVRWIHDYQDACVEKLERFMRKEMNVRADGPIGKHLGIEGSASPDKFSPLNRTLPHGCHHNNINDSGSNSR
ncbi:NAD(+) hydrolase sarm1-like isoform X2 [Stegodyphus dumicola]|uniref:NAD(+) hydrolase sarm1-like isoform X2 n=1 Tax=Stegodyphus dumicola TaxID=202533 RepID=UPI0015B2B44D|nr:NAD(+) hydrolase sarm1-like isoform X2 [Stegodyphus dumicola]